jgi:GTPase SAR1 family protein
MSEKENYFKIVFVGDNGVGKSSLILRLTDNVFYGSSNATVGT